ncbi:lysophospholipase [Parvimonas sp. G1967]|uniref:alpha/beta hydrolase n=1 Tax=Parvimonas sp. G1967 TaxID=3387695 RepID=UPI0039E387F0
MKEFYINSSIDDKRLYCVDFAENLKNPKLIVQLCHGMEEHIRRYKNFAQFLEKQGIRAFGMDNRGHGKTCEEEELKGHIADEDGYIKLVQDVHDLNKYIKKEFPDKQIVIFGHSMGSLIVRNFLNEYSDSVDGAIICGTTEPYNMKHRIGIFLAKLLSGKNGTKKSAFINKLAFKGYNSKINNKNTDFDWLTRDEKAVEDYILDKDCGFLCTNTFYLDLLTLIKEMSSKSNLENIKKDLPILFISGKADPVGDYGKGVLKSYRLYKKIGMKNVKIKLYAQMRHEILNEIDKEKVYLDIYKFLESIN